MVAQVTQAAGVKAVLGAYFAGGDVDFSTAQAVAQAVADAEAEVAVTEAMAAEGSWHSSCRNHIASRFDF